MKIYMILMDTAQLIPAMRQLAVRKNAYVLHQVTQCYTNATMYSLLTGEQLSDLVPHGPGYYGGRRFHQPFTGPDGVVRPGVVWPWRDRNVLRALRAAGFDIHVHNGAQETWWDRFIDHDPAITHTSSMEGGDFDTPEALDMVLRADPAWIAREHEAIARMQASRPDRPTMHFIVYHDMHSSALINRAKDVAYQSMIDRLDAWDWNEPDTMFWVWSDHGDYTEHHIDGRLRPQNWLAWAMVKDNTDTPITPGRRVISVRDVRPTLLARFAPSAAATALHASPIDEPLDPDRIYIVEDSRFASDSERCDATAAALFADWHDGVPRLVLQVTYDDKKRYGWDFQFFVSDFNNGRPGRARPVASLFDDWRVRHLRFAADPHQRLMTALRERIDWVPAGPPEPTRQRPGLLRLAVGESAVRLHELRGAGMSAIRRMAQAVRSRVRPVRTPPTSSH